MFEEISVEEEIKNNMLELINRLELHFSDPCGVENYSEEVLSQANELTTCMRNSLSLLDRR